MRAVVSGMIATFPVGGVAWDYGQYALGLERLGFDVYYLEDTGAYTYDPAREDADDDASYGVDFLQRSLAELSPSLADRWHLRGADGRTYGLDASELAAVIEGADLFLNVSGACLLREAYLGARRKVLIDTDPGWNHFLHFPRSVRTSRERGLPTLHAHDHFLTYAERLGQPDCTLPSLGLDWEPTRPPVVLDRWTAEEPGADWTTVMSWNNLRIPGDGESYGTKDLEFERVDALPSRSGLSLEVAVGGDEPPRERWRGLGWSVIDSRDVSGTLQSYRSYIQRSRGEFSVAKNVYVATGSGWFSCRSACYLAAGRPVVLQDTGFSRVLPTGEGLLAFSDLDGAERALATVESAYGRHQEAAREVARAELDSDVVLGELLDRIGLGGL